jgi:hypothetical protein
LEKNEFQTFIFRARQIKSAFKFDRVTVALFRKFSSIEAHYILRVFCYLAAAGILIGFVDLFVCLYGTCMGCHMQAIQLIQGEGVGYSLFKQEFLQDQGSN